MEQDRMVYIQHLVDEPRPWLRPMGNIQISAQYHVPCRYLIHIYKYLGKVYDANRVSGEFYYRVSRYCIAVDIVDNAQRDMALDTR